MNAFKQEFFMCLTFLISSLLIWFVLIPVGIEPAIEGIGETVITPSSWPKACTIGIIAFSLVLTNSAYQQWRKQPESGSETTGSLKSLGIVFAVFFLYYVSVGILGLTIASGLFSGLYAYLCGARNKGILVLIAVIIPLTLYLFFYYVARTPMPTGPLGFI